MGQVPGSFQQPWRLHCERTVDRFRRQSGGPERSLNDMAPARVASGTRRKHGSPCRCEIRVPTQVPSIFACTRQCSVRSALICNFTRCAPTRHLELLYTESAVQPQHLRFQNQPLQTQRSLNMRRRQRGYTTMAHTLCNAFRNSSSSSRC
jgi:hypothetical protein